MKGVVLTAAAVAALAVAGPAGAHGAATQGFKVLVGEQARPPAGVPKSATLNKFFPARIVVHVGDRVTFQSRGFHTVTFLAGKQPEPIFTPDPSGSTYSGIVDASGVEFYFNSLTRFVYNVPAYGPYGGKTINGAKAVSAGLLVPGENGKPVSATFTFTKPGTYKLVCLIHPGMQTTVVVKPRTATVAAPKAVASVAAKQTATAWKAAQAAAKATVPANTVFAGVGHSAALLAFVPETLRVKAGTTVRFVAGSRSEVHNMAFGPLEWYDAFFKATDLFPEGPNAPNQVTPLFPYGTDAGPAYVYDGTNHGNGVLATGLTSPILPGMARSVSVTFTTPGTYRYFCLLHGPEMAGTIVVTP